MLDLDAIFGTPNQAPVVESPVPPPPAREELRPRCFPITWQEEHRLEVALLRHRIAACQDRNVRARLEELTVVPVASLAEWMALGRRIYDLEDELRASGLLPEVNWN